MKHITNSQDAVTPVTPRASPSGLIRVIFDYPYSVLLLAGMSAKSFRFDAAADTTEVRLALVAAGTTSSTFYLYQNGVAVGSPVVLLAGAFEIVVPTVVSYAIDDDLQVGFTVVGLGAAGAMVQIVATPV